MRRVVPVLAATAGGLALLANFHTSPEPSGVAAPETTLSVVPSTVEATTTTVLAVPPRSTPATSPSTTRPPPETSTLPNGERAVDGPLTNNKWGDVQVRIVLDGRQLVDVQALRLPDSNSHSAALSNAVQSRLRREALQTQSATLHTVSGATLTSDNYISSLQGALDRAGH